MKKRITAITLALIMLLLMIPTTSFAATSGYYKYTDNGDGTCTIDEYTRMGFHQNVTVPRTIDGLTVKAIGAKAFLHEPIDWTGDPGKDFDSITIPDSVVSIGDYAFRGNGMTSFTIPDSVVEIGKGAFLYNSFTNITIPNNTTHIGDYAFCNNAITSVTIPNNTTHIGELAFGNNNISSVNILDSVLSLGGGAFTNNQITCVNGEVSNGLFFARNSDGSINYNTVVSYGGTSENIDFLPDGITSIDNYTFYLCKLTNVVIPDTVTNIGNYAFGQCFLPNITIPDNVTNIGDSAFYWNSFTNVTIPNTVTNIGDSAFKKNQLSEILIPDSVTEIGDYAFSSNKITSLEVPAGITEIGDYVFEYNEITSLTIPEYITSIGDGTFHRNKLTSLMVPSNVTSIGERAFGFNELTEVSFLASDIIIGKEAFYVNKITNVSFAGGNTVIGNSAFQNNLITTLNFGDGVTSLGYKAFCDNNLTNVIIPGNNATIGKHVFWDNKNLTSVVLTDDISVIRERAFYGQHLTSVSIAGNDIEIGKEAFAFNDLTSVSITGTIASIDDKAFYYGGNFGENITLTGSNLTIGTYAFFKCGITGVNFIGDTVSIDDNAFAYNCLTSVTVHGEDISLGDNAFRDNDITIVSFTGNITLIGERAFMHNDITDLTFSGSVKEIKPCAFNDNAITTINGSPSNGLIFKRTSSGDEDRSTIVSYGGASKHIDFIPSSVKSIGAYAFYNCDISSVTIPNSVEYIGKSAFVSNEFSKFRLPPGTGIWFDINKVQYNGGDYVSNLMGIYTRQNDKPTVSINSYWKYINTGNNKHPIELNFSQIGTLTVRITDANKKTVKSYYTNMEVSNVEPLVIKWSGRDDSVKTVPSGIYYIYIENTNLFGKTAYQYKKLTYVDNASPTIAMSSTYIKNSNNKHKISYDVKFDGDVELRIVNSDGVRVFNHKEAKTIGTHDYYWDGQDDNGNVVPSGTYRIYVLERNNGLLFFNKKILKYTLIKTPTLISDASFTKKSSEQHLIRFANSDDCKVTVAIKDTRKKTIRNIVYKADSSAGWHNLYWDGTDNHGNMVKSGTYYIYVIRYDSNGKYYYTRQKLTANIPTAPTVSFDSRYTKTGSNTHLIKFSINEESKVTVAVRDAKKRTVRNIEYKNSFAAGEHSVYWDGKDNRGNVVKQGTYYIYVIRYDKNGKYHYVRKKLTFTPFKYPTIYSNSYYTRTGSNTHQIKVDIATDAKVSTCIKDANFKTVLYLEYKVLHEDGRFYLSWDGKDKNGNDVPNGTYYIYAIKYNEDGTYKWRRKKLTLN